VTSSADLEQVSAFSELVGLGHARARLEELTPKVRELYAQIDLVRRADVEGHEMAVNYWTRQPETD